MVQNYVFRSSVKSKISFICLCCLLVIIYILVREFI